MEISLAGPNAISTQPPDARAAPAHFFFLGQLERAHSFRCGGTLGAGNGAGAKYDQVGRGRARALISS